MRVFPFVTVAAIALVSCAAPAASPPPTPTPSPTVTPTPTPSPTPTDLPIALHLQPNSKGKCVVVFENEASKHAASAVAWVGKAVIWTITKNTCGDVEQNPHGGKKALGLKHLKLQGSGADAKWLKHCSVLAFVPGHFDRPPEFRCDIPTDKGVEGLYQYEVDGDSVDPQDPDLDVKRGG